MKKSLSTFLCLVVILFLFHKSGTSQNRQWTTTNPFKKDVFVKNAGQFDKWAVTSSPIKYAINSAEKIFFTQKGVTIKLEKFEKISERELEDREMNGEPEGKPKSEILYVNMNWEGANPAATMVESEQTEGYYTFGEKGFETLKAKGFKKITYKNIYPNIDVEYTIPEKGGMKYKVILHPGADVHQLKMNYSGSVNKLKMDSQGNLIIKTPAGNITDHAPLTFYENTERFLTSAFLINGNSVSFQLPSTYNSSETVIIDPWTVIPTGLTTNSEAYDIDFDNNGNVWVSGGTADYKLSKYSSTGVFQWTFTNPGGWAGGYNFSKFCTLHNSGTTFIGEGFVGGGNPRVMKINTGGLLVLTSIPFVGSNEIWTMFYNPCSGQLIGFGGGTNNQNNLRTIADTNLTASVNLNFNGYAGSCCNDIASAKMDYNGDFYALMSSLSGTSAANGHIMKSLTGAGYAPPCAWDISTGYNYAESAPDGYLGNSSVAANALALNNGYLYSYDGKTLMAFNKSTGATLGTVIVNAVYQGAQNRTHDGVAVDECDNIYVGGTNTIHTYTFNGTAFTAGPNISTSITGEVYDIVLDRNTGSLYVCGNGFVTTLEPPGSVNCQNNGIFTLTAIVTPATCNTPGSATAVITGGNPPYNVVWNTNPPQTGLTISNVPAGTYACTIIDAGCITQSFTDSVTINSVGGVTASSTTTLTSCGINNGTATVNTSTGQAPFTYLWSNSQTTQTATGLAVGTYTCTITDNNGCTTTQIVNVASSSTVAVTSTTTQTGCTTSTGTATVNATGGVGPYTYLWSNGQTTQTGTGFPIGTFSCIVTDNAGCSDQEFVTITATNPLTATISTTPTGCTTNIGTATVSPGNGALPYTYNWSNGQTATTATGLGLGPVSVVVTDNNGCTITESISVVSTNPVTLSLSSTITGCTVNNGTATANPANGALPYTYLWTGGQTTQTATGLGVGSYTCTVTDANGCTQTQSVNVISNNTVNLALSSTISGCTVNNGTATATANNGLLPFTFLWTGGQTTQTATGLAPGSYTCTATDANGCAQTLSVTVISANNVTLGLTMTQTSCTSSTGTATANAANGTLPFTYLWSNGQTTQTATGLAAGTYTCTATDAVGCAQTLTIAVTVNNPLTLNITTTQTICTSPTGTATANIGNGAVPYTYSWVPGGQTTQTATGLGVGGYFVTVGDANGCTISLSTTITQTPNPVAVALPAISVLVSGQSEVLTASGGVSYQWSPADGLSCTNCASTVATPSASSLYCVLVTDANGCADSTCVWIDVKCNAGLLDLLVPTAFSPNHDGMNDELCIPINVCIIDFELDIFDRWGEKIFVTTSLDNCWDGTYKGAELSTAAFIYSFTAHLSSGADFKQKGTISLIK